MNRFVRNRLRNPKMFLLDLRQFGRMLKSPKQAFVFFMLVVVTGICLNLAHFWFGYLDTHISTEDAYVETNIYQVNSRLMGYVNKVYMSEGDIVHKDDVLAEIDDTDVKVEIGFKEMRFRKAQGDLKRAESLQEAKALSNFDYENAFAAFKAAEVDLQASELKRKYTKVLSSADGIVAKRSLLPGQFIQPGQSLFMIVDTVHPWVRASFKETQIEHLKPGQDVTIHVDAYPDIKLHGQVETIYPSSVAKLSILPSENASGNFTKIVQRIPFKISVDIAEFKTILRPGMSTTVSIDISKEQTDSFVDLLAMKVEKLLFPDEAIETAAIEYKSPTAKEHYPPKDRSRRARSNARIPAAASTHDEAAAPQDETPKEPQDETSAKEK
jgi:RND family efflux transporter MFP subunit